ncbi:hypothetical protein M5X00_03000 [Paenibacillus alvei]|uniref:Uncharacterized protein n=1 Tax=Paenibacillus alvei TaxID=44250 RepID=A0AAP6ZY13_PAEAL|nr:MULTISPECIES: hypothetical protein [Paenibacillus]MCY7487991.1 hypothetical protein [Paenibacillus alvei]MCY9539893.1 hypothetical protein [Paenibacillus alvei]MCY9578099.1 hypothetical protein [Paenibacillus alvei]MCY9585393.1 hypothetical protein [Paenibacillus alvei]MCY9707212.1 hypothetical protein [Paenibacillus alvei]
MRKIASAFLVFALFFGYQQAALSGADSSPTVAKGDLRGDHHLIGGH